MADFEKKFAQHRVGPGGMKCQCCGGAAHGKHKRRLLRQLKHAAKPLLNRDIERQLDADHKPENII